MLPWRRSSGNVAGRVVDNVGVIGDHGLARQDRTDFAQDWIGRIPGRSGGLRLSLPSPFGVRLTAWEAE